MIDLSFRRSPHGTPLLPHRRRPCRRSRWKSHANLASAFISSVFLLRLKFNVRFGRKIATGNPTPPRNLTGGQAQSMGAPSTDLQLMLRCFVWPLDCCSTVRPLLLAFQGVRTITELIDLLMYTGTSLRFSILTIISQMILEWSPSHRQRRILTLWYLLGNFATPEHLFRLQANR